LAVPNPAAPAPPEKHLGSFLVDLIKIWTFFSINLHIDEVLIHERGNLAVFETFMRHDMAPMAGRIPDR
jgi:hypothetical protein